MAKRQKRGVDGPPSTEKIIWKWWKQKIQLLTLNKSKHSFQIHAAKWPQ